MQVIEINGSLRTDLGKKANKALRAEEKVPCVLYGCGDNVNVAILANELKKIVYTPNVYLVKLNVEGNKSYNVILQDLQFHPVTDEVLHVDFLQYSEDKAITVEVPVRTEGLAAGVVGGGALSIIKRKVKISAVSSSLPDYVTLDVAELEIGKVIKVKDVNIENVEFVTPSNTVLVMVKTTRAARSAASTGTDESTPLEETTEA